ncbi:DUF6644 family protein [Phenylobacterium sp.]|uniref:DUF6644 family protein n=1 Tax=Phenylobacterium sp. TaxID=1871053 RepID=UPI0025EF8724|nr:DUF6644 family protein [Phenylobacterium sp.]
MLREFLVWMATHVGKGPGADDPSWSDLLAGSLNFWSLLEGTHVLSLMLFAGTIFIVDLRLLGVIFKRTPVSVVSDRILPLTIFGLVIMMLTGAALFYAKPLLYYHNLWFRLKLIFLVLAAINIMVFHFRVQRTMPAWDNQPKPPRAARLSAIVSLASWILVISCGRFIAYDWFNCGKPLPHWANVAEECQTSETGALELDGTAK